jgi:hypothetical protein
MDDESPEAAKKLDDTIDQNGSKKVAMEGGELITS